MFKKSIYEIAEGVCNQIQQKAIGINKDNPDPVIERLYNDEIALHQTELNRYEILLKSYMKNGWRPSTKRRLVQRFTKNMGVENYLQNSKETQEMTKEEEEYYFSRRSEGIVSIFEGFIDLWQVWQNLGINWAIGCGYPNLTTLEEVTPDKPDELIRKAHEDFRCFKKHLRDLLNGGSQQENGERNSILSIEEILQQQKDKQDRKFLADLSFKRIQQKIHSDDSFITQSCAYKDSNNIITRLEVKRCSYTEKVKYLISLNELMFEDCIATEYELFSLGFGYGRSSVNNKDDEKLYNKMKTEIEKDSKVHDFFLRWRSERESQIRYQCPDLFADIEKYKNLKSYLEIKTIEIMDKEKEIGRSVIQAGYRRGEAKRTEKERRQKECYALYDKMMKEEHWLKSEPKIKNEIAKKMHCNVKTITRYLDERTE